MSGAIFAANLPLPGDMVAGKYVIDRLLGRGGMGAVFAARHVKLSKPVAIKIMLADAANPEAAHRFINEGRAAANIQNEHVVRVDDVDEELGYAYMVLELLEGEDLAQVLDREKRLPANVVADYALQALRGVTQAHAIGIVHRDLKPSNLFLARRKDGSVVVKVLDFGISKAQGASALLASPSALTSTKAMLGSPLYMSPEQLRSSKSVDQRADVWAMGIILYELVTGSMPYSGENLGELFAAILEKDPLPPSVHVTDLPLGFERVILRCLERRVDRRFQNAGELMEALAPFLSAPETPRSSLTDPFGAVAPSSWGSPQLAIGASTPTGMVHLQAWQTTGDGSAGPRRSRVPVMFIGVALTLLVLGVTAIGASLALGGKHDRGAASADIPPPSASPLSSAPPPPPPSAVVVASASAIGAIVVASASASSPSVARRPSPVASPSTAPTSPPTPTPTRRPNAETLQNSR